MVSCRVRSPSLVDVEAVVALERGSLGADAWSEQLVREGIAGGLPTVHYLVAERGDALVGYAVCSITGDVAELQRMAVAHERRRSGVATALLAEAVLLASGHADRMLLEVRSDNSGALSFYAGQGFVEIDRRARYYGDGTDAVVMRRSLGRGCGANGTMTR